MFKMVCAKSQALLSNIYDSITERPVHDNATGLYDVADQVVGVGQSVYTLLMWIGYFTCVLIFLYIAFQKYILRGTNSRERQMGKGGITTVLIVVALLGMVVGIFGTVMKIGSSF